MEKHFGVISADGHCRLMHLPFDLWTKRLPRKLLENGPRVVEGPDGTRQWVVEGRVWSGVGWAGVGRGPVNCYTRAGLPEEPEPGVFRAANATYRCEDMDRDGVDAELVNGPYEHIAAIRDPELRIACVRAVNDWARELYAESDGRFIMLLPLPCQTPEEAAAELLRVADFGLPTGVIFDWVNAPEPVLHQMWEPVWAAAAATGLPVNLHANPSGGSRQLGVGVTTAAPRNQALMRVANFPMGAMGELMSAVVFSGICDRHPGVRFVLEEAGVGWVPFLFWRFDREYDFGGPDSRVFKPDIKLSEKPTAFVKRQLFFTFEVEEEGGFRRVPEIGLTNFLWASDFPGLDSPWPHSKAMGHAPAAAALGKEALHHLVFDNAVNLYKIPVTLPQERARTECAGGGVPERDVRSSRWRSIQGRYLLTSRVGTPPTGERLGGTSDPQARLAQEERGALVTSGDYRTGEKAAGTSSLLSCRMGRTPAWGGHAPPLVRASSRTRARSLALQEGTCDETP